MEPSRPSDPDADVTAPLAAPRGASGQVLRAGETVASRYRLERSLARGGMGEVYEAYDQALRERVALKAINPEIATDPEARERLRREIRLARRVSHENVCRIHDLVETGDDGPLLLTMELLEGETLAQHLARRGRIPVAEALPLLLQMAAALTAAHRAGVIHRDLKPGNVMLVPGPAGPRVVITDFGLARAPREADEAAAALTKHGVILGTPAYMAPEQARGEEATAASDIYALGAVAYEIVTGRRPFEGDVPTTLAKRLIDDPPSPRSIVADLDQRFDATIQRCMARDPGARFASADEVATAFTEPTVALPPLLKVRRSVAVLGFRNLSGRTEAAWLSTALSEMLCTELALGDGLRTTPGESVVRMRTELGLSDAESYGAETLTRIRAHLGTDYVVLGSYLALQGDRLRLDLRLQDAARGATLAAVALTGSEATLFDLVTRAGSEIREKLGLGARPASDEASVRGSLPADPEAARLYVEGLERLRAMDPVGARSLLEGAIAKDPSHPLSHLALSRAFKALGYDRKAQGAIDRALALSATLCREDRLSIEAQHHALHGNAEKAREIKALLWDLFPDNLDYGLDLARDKADAGQIPEAQRIVEAMRRTAPDDVRVDYCETLIALNGGRFDEVRGLAERTTRKCLERGQRHMAAETKMLLTIAHCMRHEHDEAERSGDEGRLHFLAAGDGRGAARVLVLLSQLSSHEGHSAKARERCEESLGIFRALGDGSGIARCLEDLGDLLRSDGETEAAERTYAECMSLCEEIGNRRRWASTAWRIAEIRLLCGNAAAALDLYEQSLSALREDGTHFQVARTLNDIASALLQMGRLEEALARHEEALRVAKDAGAGWEATHIGEFAIQLFRVGQVAKAREGLERALSLSPDARRLHEPHLMNHLGDVLAAEGDLAGARSRREAALTLWIERGHGLQAACTRVELALLSLREGKLEEAEGLARKALEGAGRHAAWPLSVLAWIITEQGRAALAFEVLARLETLPLPTERDARIEIATATAHARRSLGDRTRARDDLRSALAQPLPRFAAQEMEARLILHQLECEDADPAVAREGREGLEALCAEAESLGFSLLARRAQALVDTLGRSRR